MKTDVSPSDNPAGHAVALAQLQRGQVALVTGLIESAVPGAGTDAGSAFITRLRDLGFVPGARCEILARMWLGGDPLAVRIGGSTFALRRIEAAAVRVQPVAETGNAPVRLDREGSRAVAA